MLYMQAPTAQNPHGVGPDPKAKDLPENGQFVFHGHREFCNGLCESIVKRLNLQYFSAR